MSDNAKKKWVVPIAYFDQLKKPKLEYAAKNLTLMNHLNGNAFKNPDELLDLMKKHHDGVMQFGRFFFVKHLLQHCYKVKLCYKGKLVSNYLQFKNLFYSREAVTVPKKIWKVSHNHDE